MDITLSKAQSKSIISEAKISAFIGGIGTGKSFCLAHFVLKMITSYPGVNGFIAANTYSQLSQATIPALIAVFTDLNIPYEITLSGSRKSFKALNTNVYLYSLDTPEIIRGIEVGWACIDEVAFSSMKAIDVVLGRIRAKNSPLYLRLYSSPNGFNFFYDFLQQNKIETIHSKTSDNKNLPPEYYQSLLNLYGGEDSPLARQELFGEFINQTSSAVYYAFKRTEHTIPCIDNTLLPVYIGLDFNVGEMNATCIQYNNRGFKVINSITLKDYNANTFSMAQEIYKLYGTRAIVIPDSTANARKTNAEAGLTDIKILKNTGLSVKETHNPRIKDRHNAVNVAFHKNRIHIDPKCSTLIKELETLSNDQDEGKVSHLAVTLGYVIHYLEPLTLNNKPQQLTNPFLRNK